MKKLLIFITMTVFAVCMFAISVSAVEYKGIYYTLNDTNLTATVNTENKSKCELADVNIPEKIKVGDIEYTVTAIASYAFGSQSASQGNSKVVSVTVPYSVKTVGSYAFSSCSNITTVKCYSEVLGSYMFYNCPLVENVTLENTITISNHAFCNTTTNISNKQTQISSLVLPDTLESIGTYAFARCQITEIVIPASATTFGTNIFNSCSKLTTVIALGTTLSPNMFNTSAFNTLIITENFVSGENDVLKDASKQFTIYYTGNDPERIRGIFGDNSRTKGANAQPYNAEGNYTGTNKIIYGCNLCVVAFGGNHTAVDDGDCTTAVVCSMCKEVELKAAMAEHASSERLTYTSLMEKGEHYVGCTNDGCTLGTTTEVPALFTCLGYSTELQGYGIVCEFSINVEAINLYRTKNAPDFDYGMVVSIENNTPLALDDNGEITAADKTVVSSFSGTQYSRLQIKIANISEENVDTSIVSTLYVRMNNEVSYANDGTIGKTAVAKTYNQLKKAK